MAMTERNRRRRRGGDEEVGRDGLIILRGLAAMGGCMLVLDLDLSW